MSEAQQEKTIELLMPYRDRLNELVDAGVPMLFTGSAPEVLGSKIVNPDGSEVAGLGILDFVTHRDMPERYHDVVIGDFVPAPGQQSIRSSLQNPVHPGGGPQSGGLLLPRRGGLWPQQGTKLEASARTTSWQRAHWPAAPAQP